MALFLTTHYPCTTVLLCLVCLFDLAYFFHSSFSSLIKNMYIVGLVFGVFGGFITPAFSELMVSLFIRCTMRCEIWAQPAELPW